METCIQESSFSSSIYQKSINNDLLYNINNVIGQSQHVKLGPKFDQEPNLTKPSQDLKNIGPNVNIKFPKKGERSEEQKEFFKQKITKTKKTELCKNWELFGDCYYKDNCSFAHGELELRNKLLVNNNGNQKYKTKPCRSFIEKSFCPFGNRCQYTHLVSQNRLLKYKALNYKLANGIMIEAMKKENDSLEFHKLIENVNLNMNFKIPRLNVFSSVIPSNCNSGCSSKRSSKNEDLLMFSCNNNSKRGSRNDEYLSTAESSKRGSRTE